MFGSQILEVSIGLILTFLLVSLILTAIRETLEAWMKTRATDLERAIAELLDDQGTNGARAELYNHALVAPLFAGAPKLIDFSKKGIVERILWGFRTGRNLPSYIPRETFALAVEDLLRNSKASIRISEAYRALSEGLNQDPVHIRKGLEQLYDAAMDRAAGWYKRRTQWILFWLGLGTALVLNINAFTIAQHLATSEAARAQMVGIAERLVSERRPAANGAEGNAASAQTPGATAPAAQRSGPEPGNVSEITVPASRDAPAEVDPSAADAAQRLNSLVQAVGLPIGWDEIQVQRIAQSVDQQGWLAAVSLVFGYLAVALAATLGAPFWFDLLGKFMVIRSTVKPTEKSPDEASKDGGTGGSPQPRQPEDGGGPDPGPSHGIAADRPVDSPPAVIFG